MKIQTAVIVIFCSECYTTLKILSVNALAFASLRVGGGNFKRALASFPDLQALVMTPGESTVRSRPRREKRPNSRLSGLEWTH